MTIEELTAKLEASEKELKAEKAKAVESDKKSKKLTNSVAELTKKFEGVDMDEYAKMQKDAKQIKDGEMLNAGKVADLIDAKTEKLEKQYSEAIKKSNAEKEKLQVNLDALLINDAVTDVAIKAGVSKTALSDVIARAKTDFSVLEGKVVSNNKIEPLPMDKWVAGLNETAPHLFSESKGTGAENLKGGDNTAKTMTRSAFDAASQEARATFSKEGGKVTE